MPPLATVALRYVAWLFGLRIVYGILVQVAGLPNVTATAVILASAPMVDIALYAGRVATRPLVFKDWTVIWGLCLSLFAFIQFILPAIVLAFMRNVLADPAGLQVVVTIMLTTGAMMALFLWIGRRIGR